MSNALGMYVVPKFTEGLPAVRVMAFTEPFTMTWVVVEADW